MKLHNGNVKLRCFETDRFLCFNEPEWKLESNWIYPPLPQNCHIINDFVLFGSSRLSLHPSLKYSKFNGSNSIPD